MNPQRPRLLLVHDDRAVVTLVGTVAMELGFQVATTPNAVETLREMRHHPAEIVFINLQMADVPGAGVVRAVHEIAPDAQVILHAGQDSGDHAVQAVRLGAADYLAGPIEPCRIRALLMSVSRELAARRTLLTLETDLAQRLEFCGMVGRSSAMQQVFGLIRRLSPHARVALVRGEAGTGRELAARALHQLGPAAGSPFVLVNCSGRIDTLLERELFGHTAGMLDSAPGPREGVLEAGDRTTIFCDDIADLPPGTQAKLLEMLEGGTVQRVGSPERRPVDVRVIAATTRDLREDVAAGRFRADLYERLAAAEIELPPLRARLQDVAYLSAFFIRRFAERFAKPVAGLTPSAEHALVNARWEGNVRQLRAVIERACTLADGEFITEPELADAMGRQRAHAPERVPSTRSRAGLGAGPDRPAPLIEVQRDHIARTLERVNGNKAVAARVLGLSRRAFYRQLERHGLHVRLSPIRHAATAVSVQPS